MKILGCTLLALLFLETLPARAQVNPELSTGFVHISGDQGLDGLNAGAALWFFSRVAGAFDFDIAWDSSRLGVFETTNVGLTTVKSRIEDFVGGPRVSLSGLLHSQKLKPFVEAQFGGSHLNSTVQAQNIGTATSSATAFSWLLGGGADIKISPRWVGRVKVDFLRTDFSAGTMNRLRFGLGVAHTFRDREK
jgi:opacity protein-like surface antigen